jgi:hypothetical protein
MEIKKTRRVVASTNELQDTVVDTVKEFGSIRPGVAHTYIWPPNGAMAPTPGSTSFLIAQFDPEDKELLKTCDGKKAFELAGAGGSWRESNRHPFMHQTKTIDYGIVLDGKIDLLLDDDRTITLEKGDVCVQQGTIHAWSNRYKESCRIAFILVDKS